MNQKERNTNILAIKHPEIAKQWHPTKNGNLKPTDVTCGSGKKVWWQCKRGHKWQAVIKNRTSGTDCPYCSGRYAIKGINDLKTTYPAIAKQWHPTKNGDLKPTEVTFKSHKYIWWQCDKGHEWKTKIYHRQESGCPYCSGKKVLIGFNDFKTVRPDIAKQWHPTKNGNLKPTEVAFKSHKYIWWQCDKGHDWKARVYQRQENGCPYCSGKKVLIGFNDFKTARPDIAKQWHPTKNGNLKPTDVTCGSGKKVWWQCKRGHEWEINVVNRTQGSGCPYCSSHGTSLPEITVFYYFKKYGNVEIKHRCKDFGFELDLYFEVNNQKIGIEYDGGYSHKNKVVKDLDKNKKCKENNIILYRIRELPLTKLNDISIDFIYSNYNKQELANIISYLIKEIFNKSVKIDIYNDSAEINALIGTLEKENSIAITHPNVAKQWHPTKNGLLTPYDKTYGSDTKVWWKCECGCSWLASIYTRTRGYGNCPNCKKNKKEKVALKVSSKIQITKDNKIKIV